MYREAEKKRILSPEVEHFPKEPEAYRSVFRRDYARLIHSPCFRRLQGKTQLFPSSENDFFRNRLTHSIEVAQIAKDIALKINDEKIKYRKGYIDVDLVEFAALAHDLGHPPFGHQGEEALDKCMINHGGFEGNAQTLRLLSKIEKKIPNIENQDGFNKITKEDERVGLNLTLRTLASILKYDQCIPVKGKGRSKPMKGYYDAEKELVRKIKEAVTGTNSIQDGITGIKSIKLNKFKTIECSIMDIADDIAYSTYDLEDGLKAGFYTPLDLITANQNIFKQVASIVSDKLEKTIGWIEVRKILQDLFNDLFEKTSSTRDEFSMYQSIAASYMGSKRISEDGYYRTKITSKLVGACLRAIEYVPHDTIPALSSVSLKEELLIQVEVLKRFTYEYQIQSPKLKVAEYRGKKIVTDVFNALIEDDGFKLLPPDYRQLYKSCHKNNRHRIICDFIAGMTDRYLLEFYGRLYSESPESIFKPI